MGFCVKCGTRLPDGAVFCSKCGSPQTGEGFDNSSASAKAGKSMAGAPLSGRGAAAAASSASASSSSGVAVALTPASLASSPSTSQEYSPIIDELKRLYKAKILPLEKLYSFDDFHSPFLTDTDFDAKPIVLLVGQYSTGKCWARGTQLMMYDGSAKAVEDIEDGDLLMGDDSICRKVQFGSLFHSTGTLYEIQCADPAREPWRCNADHVLVIKVNDGPFVTNFDDEWIIQWPRLKHIPGTNGRFRTLSFQTLSAEVGRPGVLSFESENCAQSFLDSLLPLWEPLVFECRVRDFMRMNRKLQQRCTMFQPDITNFPQQGIALQQHLQKQLGRRPNDAELSLTAWVLGMWISNGQSSGECSFLAKNLKNSSAVQVTQRFLEWYRLLAKTSALTEQDVVKCEQVTGSVVYTVQLGEPLSALVHACDLVSGAPIPSSLLTDCADVRRGLLAGIIDGCGEFSKNNRSYELQVKREGMVDSCVHLARGLGVKTGKKEWSLLSTLEDSCGWRLSVCGSQLSALPLASACEAPAELVVLPGATTSSDLCVAFTVKVSSFGEYFGFELDGNGRCLLADYTVTHNTSFIRYLLEREFPGANIGPEPTTDRFMAVFAGKEERSIPGNALAADAGKPFTALTKFGMAFLNKFEGSQCSAPLLEKLIFIDTPGVLSGEKQRMGRAYNFPEVVEWFAERADRILLLFDAHKLDISDEFRSAIDSLRGNDDKIRVVLNKADMEVQHLLRVYGALMWSLGKVVKTPEVPRVYIGSFWDQPLKFQENQKLLAAEQRDLLSDLRALPRNSAVRKINELVKRARMCKVHAHIISHLRAQFGMFGKEKLQKKMLTNMLDEFKEVQKATSLPAGDFPNPQRFSDILGKYEIHKFPKLDKKLIAAMDDVLANDIPRLMRMLPNAPDDEIRFKVPKPIGNPSSSANTDDEKKEENPFAFNPDTDAAVQANWCVTGAMKKSFDTEFFALDLTPDQKVSGANVKKFMQKSKLTTPVLRQVWELSDCDKDGFLDADEFAVCCYLLEKLGAHEWNEAPTELPEDLVPPSKRKAKEL